MDKNYRVRLSSQIIKSVVGENADHWFKWWKNRWL